MTENKKYDIIVFGATGFTGKFVVEEIARTKTSCMPNLRWAIAGRNVRGLDTVVHDIMTKLNDAELDTIERVYADTSIEPSLLEMAKMTKCVLNCVGPYRFYGEQVVKACISGNADHIDISGEPIFLERMQLMYNQKAKEKELYILGACGWDSIPADMGIVFCRNNFDGDLNAVESYIEIESSIKEGITLNFGTFQSAIHGIANAHELAPIRKNLFSGKMPKSAHQLKSRGNFFWSDIIKGYCVQFMGSDKSIVYRSQRLAYDNSEMKQRPVQFNPYSKVSNSYFGQLSTLLFFIIFGLLTKFRFGCYLLEKFPSFFTAGLFTKNGPTEKQIANTRFKMLFYGNGYQTKLPSDQDHVDLPEKNITAMVSGPEPGYVSTPIAMVQAAYTLLLEREKLPGKGGVLPPGYAFARTNIIDRLNARGLKFEVL